MHFGMFRIATGEPTAAPCSVPIKVFPVEVEDGQVFVLLD
jgi:nitrite reductase/ring-hydroxylating ferredoxin subunit